MTSGESEQVYDHDVGEIERAQSNIADAMRKASTAMYLLFGLMFIAGFWVDWQMRGQVIFSPFVIADEPNANSGLFILGIVFLGLGMIVGKAADWVEEWQKVETDQTQEWTVDIKNEY